MNFKFISVKFSAFLRSGKSVPNRDGVIRLLFILAMAFFFASKNVVHAELVCAQVQIQILQKLTIERQGFEATLKVANGLPSTPLTNFNVTLLFTDTNGVIVPSTTFTSGSGLFWYSPEAGSPIASGSTSVSGSSTQTFKWLIVPTAGAAQSSIQGTTYFIGAAVSYKVNGVSQTMQVAPDYVQVYPIPILDLEYFLPVQVIGQDPTTPNIIQAPIPFPLGVRVKNNGLGTAKSLNITSSQPEIVRNDTGLAINFQIIGSQVQGHAQTPSLVVNFGDLSGSSAAVASWSMIASLTGKFTNFTANFNHTDALGGAATSLIRSATTYRLQGQIIYPYSNAIPDFLAYSQADTSKSLFLFSSLGLGTWPVATVSMNQSNVSSQYSLTGQLSPGFIYSQTSLSTVYKNYIVTSISRSGYGSLPTANAWISATQDISTGQWSYFLNLFDSISNAGNYTYTLQLSPPAAVNHPPVIQGMSDHYLQVSSSTNTTYRYLIKATDQDNDFITMSASGQPSKATFPTVSGTGSVTGTISWTPTLNDVGDYVVRFSVSDGQSATAQSMGLHVIGNGNSPLNAWRNQYWPGIIDMNVIGNAANPTKDGYPNLMKYALGADPTKANGNLTEIGTVNIGGTSYLTLTYVGRTDDPTLSFTVLAGNSLLSSGTWTALDTATSNGTTLSGGSHEVAANQSDVLNGFLRVTVRDSLPIDVNAPPRRYLRLEVQTTNP